MFFQISKTKQDNFPYNHQTANFVVSLDEGWQHIQYQNNDIWYKGYLDSGDLTEHVVEIANQEEPTYYGNFCVIKVFDSGMVIRADRLRSFPLWHNSVDGLTNLRPLGDTYWTDSYVMMNNDLTILHSKFDAIGEISDSLLSFEQVVDQVDALIDSKVKLFLANSTLPLRVFLSGGIDTGLLYSYVQKHTDNYELVLNSHIDFDYFYLKNQGNLSNLWGYNQIHHWKDACVLASGAPGDEFTARSPTTANLLLLHHGMSIPKLLVEAQYKDCLHYTYYNQEKYLQNWHKQEQAYSPLSLTDTIKTCCAHNINDWQHWHLGQTLTWTPFRDIEMFKLFARLESTALMNQVMNSSVQLELIRRNNPKILDCLSKQKNSVNYMENLTNLLD